MPFAAALANSTAGAEDRLRVEVVYAEPDEQFVRDLDLPSGSSAMHALEASGLFERYPALKALPDGIGIHGRRVEPDVTLEEGDRVEVYRALLVDPKEARRRRAAAKASREKAKD